MMVVLFRDRYVQYAEVRIILIGRLLFNCGAVNQKSIRIASGGNFEFTVD